MLRECFSLWLSGISADEEAWWMRNADTQCTVEGTEATKGRRKNLFKFFLSCHKTGNLMINGGKLQSNLSPESIWWSTVWSLKIRVTAWLSQGLSCPSMSSSNHLILSFPETCTSRMFGKDWHSILRCPVRLLSPLSSHVCCVYPWFYRELQTWPRISSHLDIILVQVGDTAWKAGKYQLISSRN